MGLIVEAVRIARRMAHWILFVVLLMSCVQGALSFSIDSVRVEPAQGVEFGEAVSPKVNITTPMTQSWLGRPSTVSRQGRLVKVEIFPSGPFIGSPALGSLTETVSLGTFDLGQVDYVVEIHPDSSVGWGMRRVEGRFLVGVKLAATWEGGAVRILWRGTGAKLKLQQTAVLSGSPHWETVAYHVAAVGETASMVLSGGGSAAFYRLVDGCVGNVGPAVSVNTAAGKKVLERRSPVVVNADAADSDGGIRRVEFLVDGGRVSEDFEAPYSFGWTNAPPGAYRVQAVAEDECGARTISDAMEVYVYDGQDVVECAKAHLASLLGELPKAFSLISMENAEWPNACLGCLRPAGCAQVVTPGKRILLAGPDRLHEIHTSDSGRLVLCQGTGTELGSCR